MCYLNSENDTIITQIQSQQQSKISELQKRQKKREANGLYHPDSVEGEDYLVCPISQVRFTKIRKPHITNTLNMTEDQYYELFPHLKGAVANRLKKKISQGQKSKLAYDDNGKPILDDKGNHMTTTDVARTKAKKTLNEIDPETGKRRYDMLGEKTRNSHLNKVDEYGMNGYQRIAQEAINNGNKTKSDKYKFREYDEITDFDRYSNIIDYFTYKCDRLLYTRGEDIKTRRQGGKYCKQVDHIYSVYDGFTNGISPICVSKPENTEIVEAHYNELKNDSSDITKNELFNRTGYTKYQSDKEFDLFMLLISKQKKEHSYNSAIEILTQMIDYMLQFNDPKFDDSIDFIRYMINKDNYRHKY